jgi:hypothetical protein
VNIQIIYILRGSKGICNTHYKSAPNYFPDEIKLYLTPYEIDKKCKLLRKNSGKKPSFSKPHDLFNSQFSSILYKESIKI